MRTTIFLATLTIIANTHVKGADFDPELNPFVDSVNRTSNQQERAFVVGITKTLASALTSAKDRIAPFFGQTQKEVQTSTVTPVITDTIAEVTVATQIEPVVSTEQNTAVESTSNVISSEKINHVVEKLGQWKDAYLKPIAIASSIVIVAAGVYQTYKLLHEDSQDVAENKPVNEVN